MAPPASDRETPADILIPGGRLIGRRGASTAVRIVLGGDADAEALFSRLSRGGVECTPLGYPGRLLEMPDGGMVGYRPRSRSGPPTIDINLPGISIRKLKFTEE